MNIAIIGSAGLPANYGGFETLAENLVGYLGKRYQFTVYCSSRGKGERPGTYKNAKLVYIPLKANGIQSVPYDIVSITKAISSADLLLILGVSGCICLPAIRIFSNKKIIVHVDGLEWMREKWGTLAKKYLRLSEATAIKYSDSVISDNLWIREYVKDTYQIKSDLIEYGGDHVFPTDRQVELRSVGGAGKTGYAVTVCRIEPENNIHVILGAFSKIESQPLKIVGNWSSSAYGRKLRSEYGKCGNIELLDPIYDKYKLYNVRSKAAFYVHGHSAGGTNPSLVEAMYLGLPVIAWDVAYNRETTKNDALYFRSTEDLVDILKRVNGERLIELGRRMAELARKYYTWEDIAERYARLFGSLVKQ